jgi:hypothetical protein
MKSSEKRVKRDKELSVDWSVGLIALYHNVEQYHSSGGPESER